MNGHMSYDRHIGNCQLADGINLAATMIRAGTLFQTKLK
jgi:hypothetical protein